jgi:hypothetical protein
VALGTEGRQRADAASEKNPSLPLNCPQRKQAIHSCAWGHHEIKHRSLLLGLVPQLHNRE